MANTFTGEAPNQEATDSYRMCIDEIFDGGPLVHVIAADDLGMTPINSARRPFRAAALAMVSTLAFSQPLAAEGIHEADAEEFGRIILTVSQMERTYLEDFQSILPGIQINLDHRPGSAAIASLAGYDFSTSQTPLSVTEGDRSCVVISTAIDKTMHELGASAGRPPINLEKVGQETRDSLAENIYGCLKQASALIGSSQERDLPDYIGSIEEYHELGIADIEQAIGGAYLLRTVYPEDAYKNLKEGRSDPFADIADGMSIGLSDRILEHSHAGGIRPEAWAEIAQASQGIAIALAYPLQHNADLSGLDMRRIAQAVSSDPHAVNDSENIALLIESTRAELSLPKILADTALDEWSKPIESISAQELYGHAINDQSSVGRKQVANSDVIEPDF